MKETFTKLELPNDATTNNIISKTEKLFCNNSIPINTYNKIIKIKHKVILAKFVFDNK